jgi:aspartate-semialdehyde dehydrogenase
VAVTTPVLSTASAFRMESDTPLLLAGVNGDHAALLEAQRSARGWAGFVAPGPNCTTVGLAVTLAPLHEAFGVTRVALTSMQALSGAGSGAARLGQAVHKNVLPYIPGEEEKVEAEAGKILGKLGRAGVTPASFPVSATCTRVDVEHGHLLSVNVGLKRSAAPGDVAAVLGAVDPWAGRDLPSAPESWIVVHSGEDRPQPKLDRDTGGGLTTVVGRIRPDSVIGGVKYFVLSHNAVLGAAGGAVLLAEDLLDRGLLQAR